LIAQAIEVDTLFLANNLVMDYSLLVGVDDNRQQLVVGVIDYIRSFTWDKKLEMAIKILPQVTSQNKKMPTIISPHDYRQRFCEKMDLYLLSVPDAWYQLDANSTNEADCS
jgi:1-phosphatidylinositol-3-phosphate 5-kinase